MNSNIMNKNLLMIFDFDHTLIEENSDSVISELLDKKTKVDFINEYKNNHQWINFMNKVFNELNKRDFKRSDLETVLLKMHYVNGIEDLLFKYKDSNLYIVSDSNSWIINFFLGNKGLNRKSYFRNIYTNSVSFINGDENHGINVIPYHSPIQTFCTICPENMCKGSIVREILAKHDNCDAICYFGDGKGDLCACCNIQSPTIKSYAFVRENFPLEKYKDTIEKNLVQVLLWNDGYDIMNILQSMGY